MAAVSSLAEHQNRRRRARSKVSDERHVLLRTRGYSPRSGWEPYVVAEMIGVPWIADELGIGGPAWEVLQRGEAERQYPAAVAAWDARDDATGLEDAVRFSEETDRDDD